VIVVYDVSRIDSFASVKRWLQEIENNCDAAVQKILGLYCWHFSSHYIHEMQTFAIDDPDVC